VHKSPQVGFQPDQAHTPQNNCADLRDDQYERSAGDQAWRSLDCYLFLADHRRLVKPAPRRR